jgi:uncharacterized protein YqgC (DUF456 family)
VSNRAAVGVILLFFVFPITVDPLISSAIGSVVKWWPYRIAAEVLVAALIALLVGRWMRKRADSRNTSQ